MVVPGFMMPEKIKGLLDVENRIELLGFLLISVVALGWILRRRKTRQDYKLPPSPFTLPVIGNLHQLGTHPHRALAAMAQRHGSVMLLHLGTVRTVIVSSGNGAKEVMKTHDAIFSNRPNMSIFRKLLYNCQDLAAAPYGEALTVLRGLVVQQLLLPKRVETYRAVREEETWLMMEEIEKLRGGGAFDLSELLSSLLIDITCRVAFGRKYDDVEGGMTFKKLLWEFTTLLGVFPVGDFIPGLGWLNHLNGLNRRINRTATEIDEFLEKVLSDHSRAQEKEHKDIVDVLLEKQIQEQAAGRGSLSRDNIKGTILNLFSGGTETISTTIEWAMAELMRSPKAMRTVQEEIRGTVGKGGQVTEDHVRQMHYLKMVIKETFRLHPVLPLLFPRESTKHVQLLGYDIPSKTRVLINAYAIGRDPCCWDNPDEFIPERFLDTEIDFKGRCFDLIPFGAGRRGCPGIAYATIAVELVLATLLHKFDWGLPGDAKVDDLDMSESFGSAVAKKYPLIVVATTSP